MRKSYNKKLRIAYFDLFHGKFYEDYSINPKRYGGGPVFARWAKEYWNNSEKEFYIFGPVKCFENITSNEKQGIYFNLSIEECNLILNKTNIKKIIPNIDYFDIIMHGHTGIAINNLGCRAVQVHWSGFGRASDGHPLIPYTFVYGPDLSPFYPNQKTYPIKIGKPVPKEFIENKKEDYIFQCSRHDESLNSIEVAENCIKYQIMCCFAGPIYGNYPLMNYIDNKYTFYLGQITEEEKLNFTKRSRLATFFFQTGCVFNQSVIECLACGTPIFYKLIYPNNDPTFRNWLQDEIKIKHNYTGFVFNGNNFLECYQMARNIDQKKCWEIAKEYSVEEMLRTFGEAIDFVVRDANIILNNE